MVAKYMFLALFALVASAQGGLLPATGAYVAPYASTYNAHHINHAVAYPVAPAPVAVAAVPSKVAFAAAPAPVSFAVPTKVGFAAPVGFAAAPVAFATAPVAHATAPVAFAGHAFAAPTKVGFAAAPAPVSFAAAPAPVAFGGHAALPVNFAAHPHAHLSTFGAPAPYYF